MSLTLSAVWSITLGATACGLLLPGPWNIVSAALLSCHAPALAWGVFDIRSQFFGPVVVRGPASAMRAALTFDDGPDPELTPAVLELLNRYNAKATFFVVAVRAKARQDIVSAIIDGGHEIACHDLNHSPWSNFRRRRRMHAEIAEAQSIIGAITGKRPALYRPPVGLMNPHVLPSLRRLGMHCIGWNRSAHDAGNRRRGAIANIANLARPGAIILLHDCAPDQERRTLFLQQLEQLLLNMRSSGIEAVTAGTMLNLCPYIHNKS